MLCMCVKWQVLGAKFSSRLQERHSQGDDIHACGHVGLHTLCPLRLFVTTIYKLHIKVGVYKIFNVFVKYLVLTKTAFKAFDQKYSKTIITILLYD